MQRSEYAAIERHMHAHMKDAAHDRLHVYRVLYGALDIAASEPDVDADALIAACLLHDIGREAQSRDPSLCHARVGADMARAFLLSIGRSRADADAVADAVRTHRYRADEPPRSIEAKILFDADKLDATGAMGVARTLIYGGQTDEPLYALNVDGAPILDGGGAEHTTFLQEFNWKLRGLYSGFHTRRAAEIAREREAAAIRFYDGLLVEISQAHGEGARLLDTWMEE